MKTDDPGQEDISWEEIQKYLNNDIYQEFLKQIPLSVYEMALREENRPKMIETILKVLRDRDPQQATRAFAEKLADKMEVTARLVLEKHKR